MAGIKRALISVSEKTGVVDMAKGLEALGAEILSTGGTAKVLREAGVTGHRCRGLYRLTGNSRWPGQDTPPEDSWRLTWTPFGAGPCRADGAAGDWTY